MAFRPMKVGEVAKRTGLTVRTLHHYEELGLLVPSDRTESRHRLYAKEDLARLQQIRSLRALGFSLEDIGRQLAGEGSSLPDVLERHLIQAREQLQQQAELVERLEVMLSLVRRGEDVTAEQFLKMLEVMSMFEKLYTPEEMQEIKARGDALGPEGLKKSQEQWARLIADMTAEMNNGSDPKSERVQALTREWMELVRAFTGGNPSIHKKLEGAYRQGGGTAWGLDPKLMEYVDRAMKP
jgi:MerR family transcriptional regulator, thiopeptide resistance regulator